MNTHYVAPYLLNPTHPITVTLIGVGGTGSQVLSSLVRLHLSLLALNHPGIHVTAYDGDHVSEANIGRQLFYPSDIGLSKATVLISRINRSFGLNWRAIPCYYDTHFVSGVKSKHSLLTNVLISCVDTAQARLNIGELFKVPVQAYLQPYLQPYYWLDFGNREKSGQVVLGTLQPIPQPKGAENARKRLPTVVELFPDILDHDSKESQGPSCSLAEALVKQDLFINSTLAQFGCDLLWKLFREVKISIQGAYVNLKRFQVNPIPIEANSRKAA